MVAVARGGSAQGRLVVARGSDWLRPAGVTGCSSRGTERKKLSQGRGTIEAMKAIMTVTGVDRTGIIAAVSAELARLGVNIINVTQTLMDEYFTMILEVALPEGSSITQVQQAMAELGGAEALEIHVQADSIFRAMHRV